MKIVIISDLRPREAFVASEIKNHFENVTIMQPDYSKMTTKKKNSFIKSLHDRYKRLRNRIYDQLSARELPYIEKTFFKTKEFISYNALRSPSQNELNIFKDYDVLITLGAPILHKKVFQAPKLCSLNLHYGLAPEFRGNDTLYWAIFLDRPDAICGTIHYLSEGVDEGEIIAEFRPKTGKYPGEIKTGTDISILASKIFIDLLNSIQNTPTNDLPRGKTQTSKGKNFRNKDRTIWTDIQYLLKRFFNKEPQKAYIKKFF